MRDDLDPQIIERLSRHKRDAVVVASRPVIKQIYEKGRYIPPKVTKIMEFVAYQADLAPEALWGSGRTMRLVNARFVVANLAAEFAPRLSCYQIDDAMLRGQGMCLWYRQRHADRMHQYPDYRALFERCRAELRKAELP